MSERVRVMVVDDEPLARQAIRLLLMDDPEIEIVAECSGADGAALVESARPDLLFLDVQMPEVDGFDLLEAVGIDRAPVVIFVTAYSEHALRAFQVHALDYLLKPVTDERFAQALARGKEWVRLRRGGDAADPRLGALLRERSRMTRRILVRDRDRTLVIDAETIDWIEAADYYACLHVGGKSHLLRRSLSDLDQELDSSNFCRIHRSAIVNLDRVRNLKVGADGEYEVCLVNGARLPLSRRYRRQIKTRLGLTGAPSEL